MKNVIDYQAIGLRIRSLRQQQELTQESLAELIDVSPSFVGHIERGEKKASLETMSRLAAMLGTTMDYLVLGVKNRCDQQLCLLYKDLCFTINQYGDKCYRMPSMSKNAEQ